MLVCFSQYLIDKGAVLLVRSFAVFDLVWFMVQFVLVPTLLRFGYSVVILVSVLKNI